MNRLKHFFKEFWQYKDLLNLLVSRNFKLKYRRSMLGYVWSVLNPLLTMTVMAIVFSTMFSRNIENFPVYLFCGQLLFNFINNSTHQAISSITGNAALLKKTYVPKYIFTIAKITSGMVDLVFSLGALVIVMVVTRAPISWTTLLFPFVIIQLYLFCIGLGLFLAQANVFFRDIQYIYNAITTAWLYLTPIFYHVDQLGITNRFVKMALMANPLYAITNMFRSCVLYGEMFNMNHFWYALGFSLLTVIIGLWAFYKKQDKFILHI